VHEFVGSGRAWHFLALPPLGVHTRCPRGRRRNRGSPGRCLCFLSRSPAGARNSKSAITTSSNSIGPTRITLASPRGSPRNEGTRQRCPPAVQFLAILQNAPVPPPHRPGFLLSSGPLLCFRSMAQTMTLTAVFQPAEEGGYIAFVEELPGANTQGETLEEARENLAEAVALILEANREAAEQEIGGRSVIREPLHITR
jgi:predicted RNase H-like HicB family nuclease